MLDGKVIGECMPRHGSQEFIRFLKKIDRETPAELDLHLIVDNYSTHKSPPVQELAGAAQAVPPALHPDQQFVAQHGRALVWARSLRSGFAEAPSRASRNSIETIRNYLKQYNEDPTQFVWTKDADMILGEDRSL